eukprot:scpid96185/ scgid30232/ 
MKGAQVLLVTLLVCVAVINAVPERPPYAQENAQNEVAMKAYAEYLANNLPHGAMVGQSHAVSANADSPVCTYYKTLFNSICGIVENSVQLSGSSFQCIILNGIRDSVCGIINLGK